MVHGDAKVPARRSGRHRWHRRSAHSICPILDLYRTSYVASQPSESFIRLQENASWAFGYTFLTAFVYNKTNNPDVYPTMFSSDGDSQPTAVFNQVAETNRQSRNLGPALVRLTSSDVRIIPATGSSLPAGLANWTPGAGGNSYISSITPITNPGGAASLSYADILIGYFEPLLADNSDYQFADGTHFMLVNGASSGTAVQSSQWYHLTFNFGQSGFDSLQLLSRDTGQVELVPLTHLSGSQYARDWNLPGGTGDLFRFWNDGVHSWELGDYNANGAVDAADYIMWRKGVGTAYTPSDYAIWRAHFGETAATGFGASFASQPVDATSISSAVPESPSFGLLVLAAAFVFYSIRPCHNLHRRALKPQLFAKR